MAESYSDRMALPAPTSDNVTKLDIEGSSVKLDGLGPMVVNSDGTLSRIANWSSMTQPEQERAIRVLSARNKIRLVNEENQQKSETGPSHTAVNHENKLSILADVRDHLPTE